MKQRRAAFVIAGLVAIPIAAGAALARLAPWESERAAAPVGGTVVHARLGEQEQNITVS